MSHFVAASDSDELETQLTGCCRKAVLHVLFHGNTEAPANGRHGYNVRRRGFVPFIYEQSRCSSILGASVRYEFFPVKLET